jgi:hypothetical protein
MIKPNELRLGNYVHMPLIAATPQKIHSFSQMGLYHEYDPIPLTPELLEKAGFRKASYYVAAYSREGWGIDVNDEGDHYELFINDEAGYLLGKINYLHQLQNAFFALTGKELTITL